MARKTAKKELEKDLKVGISSAVFVGKAQVSSDSFPEATCKEGKTWKHVRNSFGVNIGDGNTHYIRVNGGYKTDRPLLYVRDKEFKPIQIAWDDRFNKEKLANVADQDFIRVRIARNAEGKLITKQFLSPIDVSEYLNEHLANDEDIVVSTDVEYSTYNDNTYTNFNIKGIYLNEARTVNEVEQPKRAPEATMRQTYFLNEHSLGKTWLKDLKEQGFTTVNGFVPQYISKLNDVEVKKVLPFARQFKIEIPVELEDEKKAKLLNVFKRYFVVPKETVREISLVMKLNEGYVETTGEAEITAEMQELIDAGIMTEEEIKKDVTIRGDRVSEVIFVKPGFKKVDDSEQKVIAIDDEKYSPEALVFPDFDSDDDDLEEDDGLNFDASDFDDDEETESEAESETETEEEDPFNGLFNEIWD